MRPRHLLSTGLLTATFALALTTPARAQESTTRGFILGAHVGAASITVEDSDRFNGGNGGLFLGYGLNRTVTLYARANGGTIDVTEQNVDGTWTLGHFDFGARFHFANSLRSWVPFLEAAFSARAVEVSELPAGSPVESFTFSGGAFTFGGGMLFYLKETLALEAGLLLSGGEFTNIRIGNTTTSGLDLDTSSSRLNIGVAWWM